MKTIDIRGRHDVGEIIGLAWRLYARNFGPMFLIALTTAPLQMLAAVVQDRIDSPDNAALAAAPFQLASVLVTIIAAGALIHATNEAASGTRPDFARSIDAAIEHFGRLFTTSLLAGVLSLLSLIALPYFVIRWTFSTWAVMLEDKRNWSALDASSSIVKGAWWRTLGILLVIVLVVIGPSVLASAAQALPALAAATIASAAAALIIPFGVAAQTMLYFDLRARKAASEIALPEFSPEPDSTSQPPDDPRRDSGDGRPDQ